MPTFVRRSPTQCPVLVTRRLRQVLPASEDGQPREGVFADFLDNRLVVLLGEPGLGKTTELNRAATVEADAEVMPVGRFLSRPASAMQGRTLYLDGLDEHRARTGGGRSVMDHILGKLEELGSPKVRLSCRTADWYGGSDTRMLSQLGREPVVLELLPLRFEDAVVIAAARLDDAGARAFIAGARARNLDPWLLNPELLGLLLEAHVGDGGWPATRTALFESARAQLLTELNDEHAEVVGDSVSDPALSAAADWLSAVALLANRTGFALHPNQADAEFTAIHSLGSDVPALSAAARRRPFSPVEGRRVVPRHRMIAEYMAARHLRDRMRAAGLPLGRVLALITGWDGGTLSDLRGVYAWLVALMPEHAEQLLSRDPLGAVLYGDAASWRVEAKHSAFRHLRTLADQDPWFRAQERTPGWSGMGAPFGGLSCPELVPDFRDALCETGKPHLLATVLDIVENGPPRPELGDDLLAVARNDGVSDAFRSHAIDAFSRACPDRQDDLQALLDAVHDGTVADRRQDLRASLLRRLYPGLLTPDQLVGYLTGRRAHDYVGHYSMDLRRGIVRRTPRDQLVPLADALASRGAPRDRRAQFDHSGLVIGLLERILREVPEDATPERLYHWLAAGLDDRHQTIRPPDAKRLQAHLAEPAMIRAMFRTWLSETHDNYWRGYWGFQERILNTPLPPGFSFDLVSWAREASGPEGATFLLDLAVRTAGGRVGDGCEVTLDELSALPDERPDLEPALAAALTTRVHERHSEHIALSRRLRDAQQLHQAEGAAELAPHLEEIRSGAAFDTLDWAAGFGSLTKPEGEKLNAFRTRIAEDVGDEAAIAIMAGFRNIVLRDDLPSPNKLADTTVTDRRHFAVLPLLVGMEILATEGKEAVLGLPDRTLEAALCGSVIEDQYSEPWIQWILAERAELASRSLAAFWRICLERSLQCPPGLFGLKGQEPLGHVAGGMAVALLRDYPKAPVRAVDGLLNAALWHGDREALLDLAVHRLAGDDADDERLLLWSALAFHLAPDRFAADFEDRLSRWADMSWDVIAPVLLLALGSRAEGWSFSTQQAMVLIRSLAPRFDDVAYSVENGRRVRGESEFARLIRACIDHLAADPSTDAADFLAAWRDDPQRASWHDTFAHAAARQVRVRREALFQHADVEQLVAALDGGPPANAADLQALVVQHLEDIAEEIRTGSGDGWKTFWNTEVEKHVRPKVENICRNALLGLLTPRLIRHGAVAKPEGYYAGSRRADIDVTAGTLVLPVEIKLQMHDALWTAAEGQLQRLYTADPLAGGRGVYLVFWFGPTVDLTSPRDGSPPPASAGDLKTALVNRLTGSARELLSVVVIDAGPPDPTLQHQQVRRRRKAILRVPRASSPTART
ncbi:NACHT domain-containing protein [Azospirillum agricola]|uniref:hypothetical protein n=1 Tax=Azospirillum agricola TaxID=1720247 RepID=UPI000A0F2B43|nr:hypothetical protein [Azospirillum agricola]SMH61435.1 hypothetical protein SAMN02982994_5831 [Azospirillum lipoferum]